VGFVTTDSIHSSFIDARSGRVRIDSKYLVNFTLQLQPASFTSQVFLSNGLWLTCGGTPFSVQETCVAAVR
jgi:hypothetical protein